MGSCNNFDKVIRELALENRVFIIKLLKKHGHSVAEIRKELKKHGMEKPFSTVLRYVKSLEDLNIICEKDDEYLLTLKGRVLLKFIEELELRIKALENFENIICKQAVSFIPDELLNEITVIENAEVIADAFNVMWDSVRAINEAEKCVKIINKDIINKEFGELAIEKCISGLKIISVVDSSTVEERIKVLREILRDKKIEDKKDLLEENFIIKEMPSIEFNLLIVDDKGAGISLPDKKSKNSLVPALKSTSRGFINWAEKIFEWYFEKAREVKW